MNRSKRSLSAMLLLSFLASPVCGAEENLAVMAQPVIQPIHTNTTRNSLQQKVLKPDVRALEANKPKKTRKKSQENNGEAFASLAKYALVGGTALALGTIHHKKFEQAADWCMGRNSNNNSRVTAPFTEEDDSPAITANDQDLYAPRCLDKSLVRFARFIGIREEEIYYAVKNSSISSIYDDYRKDFVPENLDEILGPYMSVNDIPDDLRYILINELATTMVLLDYSKYKARPDYYYLALPFTLIRIYNLTNVFDVLKKYNKDDFAIDIVYENEKRIVHVESHKEGKKPKKYDVELNHRIDLVLGGMIWDANQDCLSGSPQFEDESVELNTYYPNLEHVWDHPECYDDPDETEPARFYRSALREDREHYMTRDFVEQYVTFPLLKHVKKLRLEFRGDSLRVVTPDNRYGSFIKL